MGIHRIFTWFKTGPSGLGLRVLVFVAAVAGVTGLSLVARHFFGGTRLPAADAAEAPSGPVRMAHIHIIEGKVSWRPDSDSNWSAASVNLPVRQGAQIWTGEHSKAEIEFDDGGRLRMGCKTLATLQTLYSDSKGEYTEIPVNDGLVFLNLRTPYSVYQVDTPVASVKCAGPARFRTDVGQGLLVEDRQGDVTVEGPNHQVDLHSGNCLDLRSADSPYTLTALPAEDGFDSWNDTLDGDDDAVQAQPGYHNLPSDVAITADNLSTYGTWRDDPVRGEVWVPRVSADWRPYFHGHWVDVDPYGWTWVSDEPWGWAPYHYGTWAHYPYGWAWCPGPVDQYWSPACVSFCDDDGDIGWCPLAPWEVSYPPSLDVGFGSGDWSVSFSIGGCGVYYPSAGGFFGCRPWEPVLSPVWLVLMASEAI